MTLPRSAAGPSAPDPGSCPPRAAPAAAPPRVATVPGALAVFLLGALPLVAFLWSGSLVDSDDAIYAAVARTMARTGEWLDLRWHDAVLHEKPPLFFWLVAASGQLLGFDDLAVRLPAALSAAGSLVLVWSLAGRLGMDAATRRLAVVLALASGCFYFTGRRVLTDPTLLFFGLLSLDAWLAARARPRRLLLWGAALGAAVLTKWLAAAPFAALALLEGLLPARPGGRSPLRSPWLLAGLVAFLAVAAPWHVAQHLRHGAEFWSVYAGYHVVERATSALVGATSPTFYVVGAWHRESVLVAAWALGALVLVVRLARSAGRDGAARWLFLWLALTLAPIHLAQTRLYHYLLPAIPALSLAAAAAMGPWIGRRALVPIAWLFALVAFGVNNGPDALAPDYSPGTKQLAPLLGQAPAEAVTVAWETYDVAATWYAGRPVAVWTTDAALHDRIAVDMMVRSGAVRLLTPAEAEATLSDARAVALLTAAPLAGEAAELVGQGAATALAHDRAVVTRGYAPLP